MMFGTMRIGLVSFMQDENRQQINQLKQNLVPLSTGLLKSFSDQEIELLTKKLEQMIKREYPKKETDATLMQDRMKRNFRFCVTRVGGGMRREIDQMEEDQTIEEEYQALRDIFDRYFHTSTTSCYEDFIGRSLEDILDDFKRLNHQQIPFDLKYTTLKKKMRKKMNQSLDPFVKPTRDTVSKQFFHKISIGKKYIRKQRG